MATKRLNLDTEELREAKKLEVSEWLDTHPYEESFNLKVIHNKIHRDIKEREERSCDTKRVELIYTGDTIFDQMKEDLLMPHLHKLDNGRPMMRTQIYFYQLVAGELIGRHPVLSAKKSFFEQLLGSLRKLSDKPREPEKQEEPKAEGFYKNVDLKSPAHQLICEELERRKIMFMWEVSTVLPGDTKSFRRIDLVVIKNFRAVIVEIDGKTHRTSQKQYQDDTNRDRLIGDHWNNQIRLEYGEVMDDFRDNEGETVMRKILSRVDPNNGLIR